MGREETRSFPPSVSSGCSIVQNEASHFACLSPKLDHCFIRTNVVNPELIELEVVRCIVVIHTDSTSLLNDSTKLQCNVRISTGGQGGGSSILFTGVYLVGGVIKFKELRTGTLTPYSLLPFNC